MCECWHSWEQVVCLKENSHHVTSWVFICTYGIYNVEGQSQFDRNLSNYFIKTSYVKEVGSYSKTLEYCLIWTQKHFSQMYLELVNLHFPDGQTGWDATAQHSALQFKMFNIAILPFLLQQPTQRQLTLNSRTLKKLWLVSSAAYFPS